MRLWRRWASDATVDGELDALQIVYLRFVHLYDYYSGEEFSDEVEMVKLRGFAHLRRKAKEVRLPVRAAAIPVSMLTSSINRLWAGSVSAGREPRSAAVPHIAMAVSPKQAVVPRRLVPNAAGRGRGNGAVCKVARAGRRKGERTQSARAGPHREQREGDGEV